MSTYIHKYTYIYIYIYIIMHTSICECIYIITVDREGVRPAQVETYTSPTSYTARYTSKNIYTSIHIYIYQYKYIYVSIHIPIRTYTYTNMYLCKYLPSILRQSDQLKREAYPSPTLYTCKHSSIHTCTAYLHLECHLISISNLNLLGRFLTKRGKRDLEN